jgi:helicase
MDIVQAINYGTSKMMVDKLLSRGLQQWTSAQEAALKSGLCTGKNLLVSAPTSSGKTTIAELAAVEGARQGHRTVYLVSHRALAEEKYRIFAHEYAQTSSKWFEVSIATGDRTEGDWREGILVATYEKFLALVCSSANMTLSGTIIVADEIQILGEKGRGPEIEVLCTRIRRGKPRQLVALSATVSNPGDLAGWLGCEAVTVTGRDVPLVHEVWYHGKSVSCDADHSELFPARNKTVLPIDTLTAVDHLLQQKQGPILVFTMTRPRAINLAEEYASRRKRAADGIRYAGQLSLFSEPSTLVRSLTETAEKGVAFHTADLTYSERAMVEQGLRDRLFEVVFATPTLAAGVNFPFQSVVFDSFYRAWDVETPWLPLADFRNMAGRAGRLGLHERGFAILLADSAVKHDRGVSLISAPVEPLQSQLISCSFRKIVLSIVAGKLARTIEEIEQFFSETLWWHQLQDKNPKKLEEFPRLIRTAVQYLTESELIATDGPQLYPTRMGVATAGSGLLPQTVVSIVRLLHQHQSRFLADEPDSTAAFIHAVCSGDEFSEGGQRYLPFARNNQPERSAWFWLQSWTLMVRADFSSSPDKVANATYALYQWISGISERQLRNMIPVISYGHLQQLGRDVAWVVEGISRVIRLPDSGIDIRVANNLSELSERLRYGVPRHLLDLLKAANAYDVPGFGRHRAMALDEAKLSSPNDVVASDVSVIAKLVESEERARLLIDAVCKFFEHPLKAVGERHSKMAGAVQIDPALIRNSYELTGEAYEEPIEALLRLVAEWTVTKLDTNKRQGSPDFLIEMNRKSVLAECKTKEKRTATLSRDEAFAVLIKGADFKKDHSLTIGKPEFDEFSKAKADASTEITLLRHQDFVEGILRYKAGTVGASELFSWITSPGFARLDTLDALALTLAIPQSIAKN